jgi:hypothetical protein
MKKLAAFLLLTAALPFATKAQEAAQASSNPNAAEITFEKDVHDFGNIKHAGNGVYEFKFTNTGKEPLIISNAQGSCGCTVPTWPKEPIKSGESGKIKVSYDTKRVGPFTKTVTITSNGKTNPKTLTIKGSVEEAPKEQTTPFKNDNAAPYEKTTNN